MPRYFRQNFKKLVRPTMIEVHTVLVLGAGASTDYGYPTGPVLRDMILDGLGDSSSPMSEQLRPLGYDDWGMKTFRDAFADQQLPTIDEFLEEHSEFARIGKLAIASALLPFERSGKLERRSKPTWYDHLWDELRQDIDNFTDNKLTIVSFNYDRSLDPIHLQRFNHIARTRLLPVGAGGIVPRESGHQLGEWPSGIAKRANLTA